MNNISKLIDEFDTFSTSYDEVVTEHLGYCSHMIIPDMMQKHFTTETPEILDLGCGTGISSTLFLQKNYNITGIDISPGMIEKAKLKQFKNLFCQSLEDPLPLNKDSFDAVLILGVLEFINDTKQLFTRINTVLKPGGIVGVTFPKNKPEIETEIKVKSYSDKDIEKLVSGAGFQIIEIKEFLGYESLEYTINYAGYILKKIFKE